MSTVGSAAQVATVHLSVRGCHRTPAFLDDRDRACLHALATGLSRRQAVAVHAYLLMDDRIHLLASAADPGAVVHLLRHLLACHDLAWRRRHGRPAPAWLRQARANRVDSIRQLFVLHRFLERLPVASGLAQAPVNYRWSSARASLGCRHDPLLTAHPAFLALAATPAQRALAWSAWLGREEGGRPRRLGSCLLRERALGQPGFALLLARWRTDAKAGTVAPAIRVAVGRAAPARARTAPPSRT